LIFVDAPNKQQPPEEERGALDEPTSTAPSMRKLLISRHCGDGGGLGSLSGGGRKKIFLQGREVSYEGLEGSRERDGKKS